MLNNQCTNAEIAMLNQCSSQTTVQEPDVCDYVDNGLQSPLIEVETVNQPLPALAVLDYDELIHKPSQESSDIAGYSDEFEDVPLCDNSSSTHTETIKELSILEDLQEWAVTYRINQNVVSALLRLLRKHTSLNHQKTKRLPNLAENPKDN